MPLPRRVCLPNGDVITHDKLIDNYLREIAGPLYPHALAFLKELSSLKLGDLQVTEQPRRGVLEIGQEETDGRITWFTDSPTQLVQEPDIEISASDERVRLPLHMTYFTVKIQGTDQFITIGVSTSIADGEPDIPRLKQLVIDKIKRNRPHR